MRFHLLGIPQCQTTSEFAHNGFNQNVMLFSRMLKEMGHTVFLYAGEYNEAVCDECIPCIHTDDQQRLLKAHAERPAGTKGSEPMADLWALHNENAAYQIAKRKQPKDFICTIGGIDQRSVADYNNDLMAIEYSVGYTKSWSPFRVFQSHAIRHIMMGVEDNLAGDYWHTVIPNFFDPSMFYIKPKEPFAIYLGRIETVKGVQIACQIAEAAGIPLKVIGGGNEKLVCRGAEYLGALPQTLKLDYLARASVLIAPSIFAEPFGSHVVEAQLSGTPVVTSDFGAFVETVDHGYTGYRCNYLGEYVYGIHHLDRLMKSEYIRQSAIERYSINKIETKYQAYFERLMLLHDKGWDTPVGRV